MKKLILAATALSVVLSATGAALNVSSEAGGRVSVRAGNSVILTGGGVTLLDAQWKAIAAPTSASPAEVKRENDVETSVWKEKDAQLTRTVRTLPDGAVSIVWDAEFSPGIAGGKYIELTLAAPKNAWTGFPQASKRTIAESRSWIEVKPDAGTFYFDFTGSTGAWKFEEMRNVNWFGHLRLLYFSGYDPAKGAKFTAKLTVTPKKPETARRPAELQGNGDEYARVVLPPEEKNAPPLLPATFRVDTKQPLRRSSARLFGYNNDWHGYEGLRMVDPAGIDPDTTANRVDPKLTAALKGVPVPFNRTAGTDSQLFRWKDAVGANRDRRAFPLWFGRTGGSVPHYGPVEHFNWYREHDPAAEFVYVVNLHNTAPQESRELAEFLTGGADTPLGRRRIALGLEKPVIPAIWELGNEMDLGGPKHMDVGPYVESCRAHIAAIRKAHPDAVFAAHAASSPWDPVRRRYWKEWNRTVLNELGPDIAYLAFHPYYRGLPPNQMLGYMDELAAEIAASPNPAVKVFNSEHAKWPPGYDQGEEVWKRNWFQTHALIGVLDTAEWMLLMLNRPEVAAQTYHAFASGPWALVRRNTDEGYHTTGIAELFRFFGRDGYDNQVVRSRLEGVGADPRALPFHLTGAAELSPDGKLLYLTLNNRLPGTERDVTVALDDSDWKPLKMTVLSAPELESVNTATERPVAISERPADFSGDKLRIPAKSLVRVTFSK